MSRARPHLDQYRDKAKIAAESARLSKLEEIATARRRKLRQRVNLSLVILACLAVGHWYPRAMRLPEPYTIVVAWTGPNWYKAYMDEGGEFRNAETGERLGQIVRWSKPD